MKLAEALIARANLQKRFNELQSRIMDNTHVQEGESPAEDPELLIEQALGILNDLESYIRAINKTNSQTMISGGNMTITDARLS